MGPVLLSCSIALLFEVPLCVFLARWGARRFAYYLSGTEDVSHITEKMWRVRIGKKNEFHTARLR